MRAGYAPSFPPLSSYLLSFIYGIDDFLITYMCYYGCNNIAFAIFGGKQLIFFAYKMHFGH
jgi:hypothetical protein